MISVGALLATGIVNGWLLVGGIPALAGTDYGRLLLIKLALFVAMVVIAAFNRLRLTPRLVRAAGAAIAPVKGDGLRALARNSMIEATLGLAIVVIVGALGTTPPGSHVQPTWPFAIRYSDAAFSDPDLRDGLVLALWTSGIGVPLRWPADAHRRDVAALQSVAGGVADRGRRRRSGELASSMLHRF